MVFLRPFKIIGSLSVVTPEELLRNSYKSISSSKNIEFCFPSIFVLTQKTNAYKYDIR